MTKATLIAIAFCILVGPAFTQSKPPAGGWPIIYISFEKFGKAIDPMNERIAEGGDSSRSKDKGKDVWLDRSGGCALCMIIGTAMLD